jgi:hypothetical protein
MLLTCLIILALLCVMVAKLSAVLALMIGGIGLVSLAHIFKKSINDEFSNLGILAVVVIIVGVIVGLTGTTH